MQQTIIKYRRPAGITRKLSAAILLFMILLDIESIPGNPGCPGTCAPETGLDNQLPAQEGNLEWPDLSFYRFQL